MDYSAKMRHNADTITKLVVMQYNTFQFGKKIIRVLLALGLIVYGFFNLTKEMVTPIIAFFLGSVLISGTDVRAKYNAKKVIKQLNGHYPKSDYFFSKTGFRDSEKSDEIPYSKLIKLIDDKEYLYLYINKQAAYMVDNSTVKGEGGLEGLKDLVATKAALKWDRPITAFNFSINSLKKPKDKDDGPRLGGKLY